MNNRQKKVMIDYFTNEEKTRSEFLLGIEVEHFVVQQKDLTAVPYFGEQGIESILQSLADCGWQEVYEGKHLLGLDRENMDITLEPGGQLEISIAPRKRISEIDDLYQSFLAELIPILESQGAYLMNLGYQPQSRIQDIPLLPKKRYDYMYDYFKKKGKYAHNMMKGTAAVHTSYDFSSEKDFIKKCRVASFLVPIIYIMFDNTPFFEGEVYSQPGLRSLIWDNCDRERCGPLPGVFSEQFGYGKYAEFLLNTPPIIWKHNGELTYTEKKPLHKLLNLEKLSKKQLEYLLTMVFPDIRIKNCLEIRAADSIPYPYNISYLSFWEGLLYNDENLDQLHKLVEKFSPEEINQLRSNILNQGLEAKIAGKKVNSFFAELLSLSRTGLPDEEKKYNDLLQDLFATGNSPRLQILNELARGKKEALDWCIINNY
ncbi:MAG: glutamate--cysteine ligase [Halanaerobiaceae bacterium]